MTTYIEYFEQSLTQNDESSPHGLATYKWGGTPPAGLTVGNIPANREIDAGNVMGLSYPTIAAGNFPQRVVQHHGTLVNLVPVYGMLGKAAHTIANQKQTITNFTTTQATKPFYLNGEKIGSLDRKYVYNCMIRDLAIDYITGGVVTFNQLSIGKKVEINNAIVPTAPIFPSSIDSEFDVFTHFKWGVDGSEAAVDKITSIQCRMTQGNPITTNADEGYLKTISPWDPIYTGFVVQFREENAALYADQHTGTKRSILWKMAKSAAESGNTHNFEFDTVGASAICNSLVPVKNKGQVVSWTAVFTCADITCVGQDYVADTFYTIPT